MARFTLAPGATEKDLGEAILAAAVAYHSSGRSADPAAEGAIRALIAMRSGDRTELRYDGVDDASGENVIHIVIPDVSDKITGKNLDCCDLLNELLGSMVIRGCSR